MCQVSSCGWRATPRSSYPLILVPVLPTSARTYYILLESSWIRSISTRPRGDQVVLLVDVLEAWALPDTGEYRKAIHSRDDVGAAGFREAVGRIEAIEGGRYRYRYMM